MINGISLLFLTIDIMVDGRRSKVAVGMKGKKNLVIAKGLLSY